MADWSAYTSFNLLPQENINTTWSRPHYIQSVTSKTCLEYLIIPWWIKGKTFKTRLIDIYNCLDELYLEHLSVSKFKPNVTVRFYSTYILYIKFRVKEWQNKFQRIEVKLNFSNWIEIHRIHRSVKNNGPGLEINLSVLLTTWKTRAQYPE